LFVHNNHSSHTYPIQKTDIIVSPQLFSQVRIIPNRIVIPAIFLAGIQELTRLNQLYLFVHNNHSSHTYPIQKTDIIVSPQLFSQVESFPIVLSFPQSFERESRN